MTPDLEAQLAAELAPQEKRRVAHTLQLWRPLAMELMRTTSARERQQLIERYAAGRPHWAFYAVAAWITRTLALAEHLERADLAIQPKKWAAMAALNCVDDFEADDAWLWPFETESPWPEQDDDA